MQTELLSAVRSAVLRFSKLVSYNKDWLTTKSDTMAWDRTRNVEPGPFSYTLAPVYAKRDNIATGTSALIPIMNIFD